MLFSGPSLRHQALATLIPRLREARELDSVERERHRLERWHARLDRSLPTRAVPLFDRFFTVERDEESGFPTYTLTPRGRRPRQTVLYVHGGGFVAPIDAMHVRYAAKLARSLRARVVMPDYPLAPEATWKDSHDALVSRAASLASDGQLTIAGDSAGGNIALAVAIALRDAGGPQALSLLLLAPWVDLTTSTPETEHYAHRDPWLMFSKLSAYAEFWAGSEGDLGRPEVSPGLGDLAGLPPALMFCGTRDLLLPGCRLLARRARDAGWDLTYVEERDLLHVYPLFPFVPEAARAWRRTLAFLREQTSR